jgi:hypothetical protein
MHLTSARIFFPDYLHFATIFFSLTQWLREFFFQAFFFAQIFWGEFLPPPPGIFNGPPLTDIALQIYCKPLN